MSTQQLQAANHIFLEGEMYKSVNANLHLQIMQLQMVINSYFESNEANKQRILNVSKQLESKELQFDNKINAQIIQAKKEKRKAFLIGAGSAIAVLSILNIIF